MWTGKGHLRMGGRIKEQINRAGEKIMPAEIEAYLCKHSDIKEAAVVGVPDVDIRKPDMCVYFDGKRKCAGCTGCTPVFERNWCCVL